MALKHHDDMASGLRQAISMGLLPNEDLNVLNNVLNKFDEIRPSIEKRTGDTTNVKVDHD